MSSIQRWAGFVMPLWDAAKVDHVEPIEDDEAVEMTARLAREEGIFPASRPERTSSAPIVSPSAWGRTR